MGRVAVVTGGSRGIGAAISKALKAAGYKVAATYAGNDEAANAFKAETGIPVYKWDVSNTEACAAGLKQVAADWGPIEILVNNAGITRDAMFHKMTAHQWNEVIGTNLTALFNMTQPIWGGMRDRRSTQATHHLTRLIATASTSLAQAKDDFALLSVNQIEAHLDGGAGIECCPDLAGKSRAVHRRRVFE